MTTEERDILEQKLKNIIKNYIREYSWHPDCQKQAAAFQSFVDDFIKVIDGETDVSDGNT